MELNYLYVNTFIQPEDDQAGWELWVKIIGIKICKTKMSYSTRREITEWKLINTHAINLTEIFLGRIGNRSLLNLFIYVIIITICCFSSNHQLTIVFLNEYKLFSPCTYLNLKMLIEINSGADRISKMFRNNNIFYFKHVKPY